MERVVVLGRGGAGKSTLARRLAAVTGFPLVELDRVFWGVGRGGAPVPLAREEWVRRQGRLAAEDRWVLDGDLGPYDAPAARLRRAGTVVVLDLPLAVCAWRAARRSRERADFWWWLLAWRRRSRPALLRAVADCAPEADVRVLRRRSQVEDLVRAVAQGCDQRPPAAVPGRRRRPRGGPRRLVHRLRRARPRARG